MAFTALEASCDIATMRAILSSGVTIGCKLFPTKRTGKGVDRFPAYLFRMTIPPPLTASSRTKFHFLPFGFLNYLFAAEKTKVLIGSDAGIARSFNSRKPVGTTVCFYIIFSEAGRFGDSRIAIAAQPHSGYALPLFVGHTLFLQSEEPCPHYPLEKTQPIVQKNKKIWP